MTKQTKIIAAKETEVQQWPLIDTYVSEHNPRVVQDDDETIAELAKTIVASGLIHNLSGLIDGQGNVGIVAGGRRWRALQIAVLERPALATIPIKITDDLETALSWAMLENSERQEMDKADEIRAYGQSADKGLNVAQIAKAYCVTEAHVHRRLALSNLPAPVLDALKAREINLGQAKAFTRSDDEGQILEILEEAKGNEWFREDDIIEAIEGETLDADCRKMRFVGVDTYKQAGGTIKTNLFDEDATVENVDMLEGLFAQKLEDAADALQKELQVAWVDITTESYIAYGFAESCGFTKMKRTAGVLTDEQQAQYDELSSIYGYERTDEQRAEYNVLSEIIQGDYTKEQNAFIGVIVYADRAGHIKHESGYVKPDQFDAAVDAGFIEKEVEQPKTSTAPEFAKSFVEDMTAYRLAAVQTALLRKPELVLDLLAYGLGNRGLYSNNVNAIGFQNERNKPTKDDDAFTLSPRLGGELTDEELDALDIGTPQFDTEWDRFEAFRANGKKTRNGIITEQFARSFKSQPNEFMEMIETEAGASLREIWTPTAANCFKRMKKDQLDNLFADLLDLESDSVNFKGFVKSKLGEKAIMLEKLFSDEDTQKTCGVTSEQKAKIDAWIPECFD